MPSSTYRLQITADFTLTDAAELVDYVAALGVGAIYVSPLLRATEGSSHGYDVVSHLEVDPARGGTSGLAVLAKACAGRGLGLVVDIVPNHMGVADPSQNRAWWDLLTYGEGSEHASWFDVDWGYADGRILIPVLGDDADLSRDLTVVSDELRYYEHRYPINPDSRASLIAAGADPDALDPLAVHDAQHYRLVSFRKADTEQNYRRFFAVTDLAGLRVEDPAVFEATHAEILRWVADYGVSGIRIDHPDGLVDPQGYLERLATAAPKAWITVEKITEPGEELPASWPVSGMTGYDALAEVNGVLVDPAAEGTMTELYQRLTGDERSYADHIADGKRLVATTILQAEIRRLDRLVTGVENAAAALAELVIAFPVYRSYLPLGADHLDQAVRTAKQRRPELSAAIEALLPRLSDPSDELAMRFQQVTGAVTAKGVEDTAYYRYTRLISLNEVGAYPGRFGLGVADFHAAQQRRLEIAAAGMTTLSTHDTKRGEDIRARISVLPELGEQWASAAGELLRLAPVPNAAFGYLLWQTIAATGLIDRGRLHGFAEKAMREAADGTGWIDPDEAFEAAVHAAVDAAYDDPRVRVLITDLHDQLLEYGWSNSLSAKLVQLTMPGVPDVYQGSEWAEESLVDPDNRRPVDFAAIAQALSVLRAAGPTLVPAPAEQAKLWLTTQALTVRRDHPELFTDYVPLQVDGPAQDHLLAFDRGGAVTLATRLPLALAGAGGWTDTSLDLPDGRWTDILTGREHHGTVRVAEVLDRLPVALLLRAQS
ncbi:malto-oligosyltrehalose synthase [Jatrophihabitans telluris]|uniref:Malto-oligosyltrehalose synthase n=1 Tax=Jatrophihabitans telluris TaxID=2038343 RepID=A0ABY4QZG0_9ACTN|nr:malto-oligosyltrehalose synthase [Jatrophihabitans telluris]UQX88612.1 malto-oligosyltrehalose synthase [Jatrophihabitans telluris]